MDGDSLASMFGTLSQPLFQAANATSTSSTSSATGNYLFDGLLLAAVPIVLQFVLTPGQMDIAWRTFMSSITGKDGDGFVYREVKATTRYGPYYVEDSHEHRHGHILQKALAAHLTDILKLRGKEIRYEMVEKDPTQIAQNTMENCTNDDYSHDGSSNSEDSYAIDRLRVGTLPKMNTWVEVDRDVFFRQYIDNPDSGDDNSGGDGGATRKTKDVVMVFQFKTKRPQGTKVIDQLIADAFAKYQMMELQKLANDKKKYMYVQTLQENKAQGDDAGDGDNGGEKSTIAVVYKRYALGEEKSFKNLFFDEKPQLLQLLDSFMTRSGKFAIEGFPYKLGLLLHGPPGTGKTSLIKAVAQYTKRHIVTISLGKIKTNQELMNAIFDLRFSVEGVDLPINMTFEDVIFVMEDIDCAASVVMAREHQTATSAQNNRRRRKRSQFASSSNDKLNLSGLLNVLDGVIDCPGRIVIMTTNHPDKLDPALIRPGRVNKKLMLGYMSAFHVKSMLEYYFLTALTKQQEETLFATVDGEQAQPVTPAAVEALCAEFDDIDSALAALARLQQVGSSKTKF